MYDDIVSGLMDETGRSRMFHLIDRLIELFLEDEQAAARFIEQTSLSEAKDDQTKADLHTCLSFAHFFEENDDKVDEHVAEAESLLRSIDEEGQAVVLRERLGIQYLMYQQPRLALQHLELVRPVYEQREDAMKLASVLNNTGNAYIDLGEYKKALPCFKKSVELNELIDSSDLVNSYNNLASVYFHFNMFDHAFKHYRQALDASERYARKDLLPHIYSNIATINTLMHSYDEALEYYKLTLSLLSDSIEDRKVKANTLNNLGRVNQSLGRFDEAEEAFRQAIVISQTNRFLSILGQSYLNMASGAAEQKTFTEALRLLGEAEAAFLEVGDNSRLFAVKMDMAEARIELGEMDEAERLLNECVELVETTGATGKLQDLNWGLARYYEATGDTARQATHLKKLVDLFEKELGDSYTHKLAEMQSVFDLEQKEKEAEIHRLKNVELKRKNEKIMRQKEQLEKTLAELHKSEIGYEYLNREIKDMLGSAIVGESKQIQSICSLIRLVANTPDTSVLITGETGVGKELVARAIHDLSDRRRKNFCAVNISSISETLFESEFFGHRKNAFTGADRDKAGWFEIADGGTLFLDEIGAWKQSMQAKFLRVLESRTVIPVGGDREMPIDIRLVSATNDDLQIMLDEGRFRADLYYRLSSFVIHIPPLRERADDIPMLLEHFVKHFNEVMKKSVARVEKQLEEELVRYAFPGNVRELKNMVERAMIMCRGSVLRLEHFTIPSVANDEIVVTLADNERRLVVQALKRTGFHQAKAAKLLGITPKSMERRVKKFGIVREETLFATKSSQD